MTRLLRAALLLAALTLPGLGAACEGGADSEIIARTTWDCAEPHPWVTVRADHLGDPVTIEHERVHVEQARRMGCGAWSRAIRSAGSYRALETEAVCEAHRRVYGRPMAGELCEGEG